MIDISLHTARIAGGRCIILTGSGFSATARNFEEKEIPDTKTLTKRLLDNLLVRDAEQVGFDLRTATTKFLRDTAGDSRRLVDLITPALTAKTVTAAQIEISSLPWHRIYTTNFDNVHEVALQGATILSESFSRDGPVRSRSKATQQIVHLHGFVSETNPTDDLTRFVLSLESYAEQRLDDSKWLNQFRIDARTAPAVFVVGHSLSDTHLSKIFLTDETIRRKTIIVTEEGPSLAAREALSTFGYVSAVGTKGFSRAIAGIKLTPEKTTEKPASLIEVHDEGQPKYDARDVDELLMFGRVRVSAVQAQLATRGTPSYFVERAGEVANKIMTPQGKRIAIIHSDVGNGKTVFVAELTARLVNAGKRVFVLNAERDDVESLQAAVTYLEQLAEGAAVVIEDFWRRQEALNILLATGRSNIIFLMTSRTVIFELNFPKIDSDLRGRYLEVNINHIPRSAALQWIDYLLSYGYWKEKASYSVAQKENFIANKCHAEVRGILLALLDSPVFKQKLDQYFARINELESNLREVTILSTFLTVLNFAPSHAYFLSVIMDKDYQRSLPTLPESSDILEIISRRGELTLASAIFGEYFLREFVRKEEFVGLISDLARKLDEKRHSIPLYGDLLRRVLRFSSMIILKGRHDRTDYIIDFFERNSTLGIAKSDPLFWVQYSISRMDRREYGLCENYIKQAYGIAKNRTSYDTYQIDTHHARFLLESRIDNFKEDVFDAFEQANRLILRVMDRREEDLLHPLQASQLYLDFFYKHKEKLTEKEVSLIVGASREILERMRRYPSALLERNSVGTTTANKLKELERAALPFM